MEDVQVGWQSNANHSYFGCLCEDIYIVVQEIQINATILDLFSGYPGAYTISVLR